MFGASHHKCRVGSADASSWSPTIQSLRVHRCDQEWSNPHGVGRPVGQRLVTDDQQVLEVPAKLAGRMRMLVVSHGRKSDHVDAVSVVGNPGAWTAWRSL